MNKGFIMICLNSSLSGLPPDFHIYGSDVKDETAVETELSPPLAKAFAELKAYNPIYTTIVLNLKTTSSGLTKRQCKVALETILATAVIEKSIPALKIISHESQRNKEITRLTSLNAEAGFSKGSNENEVERTLREWIDTLLNFFQTTKRNNSLVKFFKAPSSGDPCFNGRYISIMKCAAEEDNIPLSSFEDAAPELYTKAYEYTVLMTTYRESKSINSLDSPSKEEFIKYLKTLPDYETMHRPLIESHMFATLFPLAVEMDSE